MHPARPSRRPATPPPIYSLLVLGGAEAFFLSSSQKLISTEISDKQTSQAEAEFEKSSNISQQKPNVE